MRKWKDTKCEIWHIAGTETWYLNKNFIVVAIYYQESKGLGQWSINWCKSTIIKHKYIPSVDYNKWMKRFITQLDERINQNSRKSLKLLIQQI